MKSHFTLAGCHALALAAALALPGLAMAQTPPAKALAAFATTARTQGLNPADAAAPFVTSSYLDASTGLTHTYLQQQVNGLAVFNATGAVHTDAAGKVVFATQDFVANATAKAGSPTPTLTPEQAVTAAAVSLGLPRPVALRTVVEARVADGVLFNNGGISQENIPVRLLYTRQGDKLVLVWNVTIAQLDQQHVWLAQVDAQTGRLAGKTDQVVHELTSFSELAQRQQQRAITKAAATLAAPAAVRNILSPNAAGSLTVFPVPLESPDSGPRQVVPLASANPTYSPYGWQVSLAPSGTFPNSYSLASSGKFLTRGNNVAAYDDNSNTVSGGGNANYASPTSSPDGGSTLNFDFPFVQANGARANLNAAVTNLFYWNNINHDVMMAHGFDEVSGNFQYKNATGTGAGVDPVRAEAQDGSGRDNANFYPPADGQSGVMQMYLFDNTLSNNLVITGPATVAGGYRFASVSFGPSIAKKPLAGKLVLVNDGVSADGGDHGCASPYLNAATVAGNIAFIQRGGCQQLTSLNPRANNQFAPKVKRAQANGATAVIVFDSLATTNLVSFGGTDTVGIRIPAIFISGADGFKLRAALLAGGNLTASAVLGADYDGSFDNTTVSHEYGHGVSTRLTGGPANSNCLNSSMGSQSMGEGWSDFFALWITTRAGDVGSTPRYNGSYLANASYGSAGYLGVPGFRRKAYSTDFAINSYTYAQLGTGTGQYSETHDVGEVWTTVLWDLNWQFIYRYGFNADFQTPTTGGNNKMLKLVLDGCKLQVCNPGFLDGRDALLRADTLTNRAANADIIWNAFARRGMGYSAVQGDRANGIQQVTGIKEAFDLPPNVQVVALATQSGATMSNALEAFPNPAQGLLTVRTQLSSAAPMQVAVLDLLGKMVLQATAPAAQMQQAGIELNTSRLATGLYIVRVTTTAGTYTTKVTIQR